MAVDVSDDGAALELFGDKLTLGEDVLLKLDVNDDDPAGILLRATVRYAEPTVEGGYRAGVRFEPLAPVTQMRLTNMLRREAAVRA